MAHKSNAFPLIRACVQFMEKQFNAAIKITRSDNGLEFKERSDIDFYKNKGILYQTSCVDTVQQRGVVERKYQHLVQVCSRLCSNPICL